MNSTGNWSPLAAASESRFRFVASIRSPATYRIARPRRNRSASSRIASRESFPGWSTTIKSAEANVAACISAGSMRSTRADALSSSPASGTRAHSRKWLDEGRWLAG